jgi:hypothetical protein
MNNKYTVTVTVTVNALSIIKQRTLLASQHFILECRINFDLKDVLGGFREWLTMCEVREHAYGRSSKTKQGKPGS